MLLNDLISLKIISITLVSLIKKGHLKKEQHNLVCYSNLLDVDNIFIIGSIVNSLLIDILIKKL